MFFRFTLIMAFRVSVFLCFTLAQIGCGYQGSGLFSQLVSSRVRILLKGTYATDNPLEFTQINENRIFVDEDDQLMDLLHQSSDECSLEPQQEGGTDYLRCVPSYDNIPIYIDIGGVRLSSRRGNIDSIQNANESDDFWETVAVRRQVYCSQAYANSGNIDSCNDNNGIEKFQQFMNGDGAEYPASNINSQNYLHAGVFIRSIVTGWGNIAERPFASDFDSTLLRGAELRSLVGFSNPDEPEPPALNPGTISEWFPLHFRIGQGQELFFIPENIPAVLEIRFNIKENLMVHSYQDIVNGLARVISFSDWRKGHQHTEDATSSRFLGGNVLTRARFYYPQLVSQIRIQNPVDQDSILHYYGLYGIQEEIGSVNHLPHAATPARGGNNNVLNFIMPGQYRLECLYDEIQDGYPEKSLSSMEITIPEESSQIDIEFSCGSPEGAP